MLDVGVFGMETILDCDKTEPVVFILLGGALLFFATDRRPEIANECGFD